MYTVVFDVDGVLSEFTLPFKSFVNRFFRYPIAPTGAQRDWNYSMLSRADLDKVWDAVADGDYDWSLQPSLLTAGDHHALAMLRSVGLIDFQYITSRVGPRALQQTQQWLRNFGCPPGDVTVANNKVEAVKRNARGEVIGLIDDAPHNIAAFIASFGGSLTYCRDWQYNRAALAGISGYNRVSSVAEFCYEMIEKLTGIDNEGKVIGPRYEGKDRAY